MSLFDRLVREVAAERQRQDEKWGVQNHPMTLDDTLTDSDFWRTFAEQWKRENNFRVQRGTQRGLPKDRNCAWDGILIEELAETFAEERPGLQYVEAVQTAGVAFAILDFLNRQSMELRGHFAGCPALDIDGLIHAPEACDCKNDAKPGRYVVSVWTTGFPHSLSTYGVLDTSTGDWAVDGNLTREIAEREAERLNSKALA